MLSDHGKVKRELPYSDPEAQKEYRRNWRLRRRSAYFADKCCAVCGSQRDLELDHIDPADKVTHRIWTWPAEKREIELAKCQVLCHSCHLEKTVGQRSITHPRSQRHGTPVMYRRHGCRCGLCRLQNRNRGRAWRMAGSTRASPWPPS